MTSPDLQARRAARDPGPAASGFRPDVEGLRALAVALVIAHHLGGRPSGGFLGVDVFFVISGYLITGQLIKHLGAGGYPALAQFYRRRARRILPQAILVIGTTLAASAMLLPTSRLRTTLDDGIWSLFFAGNWRMIGTEADYFQLGIPPSPFQHYWSLGVEEQFYLVWPAVIAILAWVGLMRRHRENAIAAAAIGLLILSAAWAWHQSAQAPEVAYYASTTRGWELATGAALAATAPRLARLPSRLALVRPLCLIALLSSTVLVSTGSLMPWPAAVPCVVATALLLVTGQAHDSWRDHPIWDWPLVNPLAQAIGRLSFALYLWHFPVIVLLESVVPAGTFEFVALSLLLIGTLSGVSYLLVEQPVRRSNWLEPTGNRGRRGRPQLAVVGLALLLGTGVTAWGIERASDLDDGPSAAGDCFGAPAALTTDQCTATGELSPSLDLAEVDSTEAFVCWTDKDQPFLPCTYTARTPGGMDVTLIGDSHAASLLPGLRRIAEELGWRLTVYTGYGCQWRVHVLADECRNGMKTAESAMLSEPLPDLIVTTAARWAVPSPHDEGAEYADRWRRATSMGVPVVAIADNPEVTEEALACLRRISFDPATDQCTTPREVAYADSDALISAVALTPGAALVVLDDVYCTATACPTVIGDAVVYRDTSDHLTDTFSRSLFRVLLPRIERAATEARASLPRQKGSD